MSIEQMSAYFKVAQSISPLSQGSGGATETAVAVLFGGSRLLPPTQQNTVISV